MEKEKEKEKRRKGGSDLRSDEQIRSDRRRESKNGSLTRSCARCPAFMTRKCG